MSGELKRRNNAAFPLLENQLSHTEDEVALLLGQNFSLWFSNHKFQRLLYSKQNWSEGLSPGERLSQRHTLASARRIVTHGTHSEVPNDRLDLALSTHFHNDGRSAFIDFNQFYSQPESAGKITWKVFRNNIPPPFTKQYQFNHPLRTTGASEKNLAHKINLGASLEHSVLTGPNFHRRTDGGFYRVV